MLSYKTELAINSIIIRILISMNIICILSRFVATREHMRCFFYKYGPVFVTFVQQAMMLMSGLISCSRTRRPKVTLNQSKQKKLRWRQRPNRRWMENMLFRDGGGLQNKVVSTRQWLDSSAHTLSTPKENKKLSDAFGFEGSRAIAWISSCNGDIINEFTIVKCSSEK